MLATRREAVLLASLAVLAACSKSDGTAPVITNTNACASSTPVALTVGQVVTATAGAAGCTIAGGSAHQEYVLVPFYGTTVNSQSTSLTISGSGLDQVPTTPAANLVPRANMLPGAGAPGSTAAPTPDHSFELRLRQIERRALPRFVPAARSVSSALRPNFVTVPGTVKVGDTVSLNTNATAPNPCAADSEVIHEAVVEAITQKAIVVADVNNPANGFTQADYQSVGTTFDTLVDPVDQQNFGAPTDIDQNGHIVLFFTEAVNHLTPPRSSSYVGGFFFARDLFPTTGTNACPASNYAEMFYLLVPDSTGSINGNVFKKAMVEQNTIGTTGHEYQHLINAARRMYVNNAGSFEEVWLNEGLSHIAEALLFYRESGLHPREDIDSLMIVSSNQVINAFNDYQANNFGRYDEFVKNVGKYGPYSDNDSLATRGATWDMLRYLTDRKNTTDATVWMQLVNSDTAGIANLKNVYGSDVVNQIRDWATAVYTDDLPGVGPTWEQPSWNVRSIMHYHSLWNSYPLTMEGLEPAAPVTVSLVAGGSAYVQFATPANGNATLQWTSAGGQAVPTGMQFSLVRIK